MEDKMFELMIKMYSEFTEFRKETKSDINGLKDDVNGLKDDINGLKDDVNGLKGDVVRIEYKLDTNSKALFDGYSQTYEKVVSVEKAVNELASKVEKQEVEIKVIKGGK
jgi:uncharacterized protein YoxC